MLKRTPDKPRPSKRNSELQNQFLHMRPVYERFTMKLEARLRELLDKKSFAYHLVESRSKNIDSFLGKICRTSKAYQNLPSITDISGVRVITYYHDDALAIGAMIQDEFPWDSLLSRYDSADASTSEFGYRSVHYIVRAPVRGENAAGWEKFRGMCGEVQVRTVLQHAWAAISHKLQYKRERDVPVSLRRKLSRLSALFELADDEFMAIRHTSRILAGSIDTRLQGSRAEAEIDPASMTRFIERSRVVLDVCNEATKAGFVFRDGRFTYGLDMDDPFRLSALTEMIGLRTIAALERTLLTFRDHVAE